MVDYVWFFTMAGGGAIMAIILGTAIGLGLGWVVTKILDKVLP